MDRIAVFFLVFFITNFFFEPKNSDDEIGYGPIEDDDEPKLCLNGTEKESFFGGSAYVSAWMGFFLLGTFNNFSYCVILASAKSLCNHFDSGNLIGVVQWSLIGTGFIVK